MISVRTVLIGLALAFTAYFVARGLWWTDSVPYPLVMVAALGLYLMTTGLCLFGAPRVPEGEAPARDDEGPQARRPVRLPVWAGAIALTAAVLVPNSVAIAVDPASRTAPFATWCLGGIGALMTIVMVRRRPWVAWSGIALLALSSAIWMGLPTALALGLVGSIFWVAAAQLVVLSMDRAAQDTFRLTRLQRAASAWQVSQEVRARERRVQVQNALAVAGPILMRAVATGCRLDDTERLQARIAEGRLRDEMRGRRLLDDAVRSALETARRRGATVTVLDEGGLEGIDGESLVVIREELAETLRSATSDRLYIRTSPHAEVAVTVVGRSGTAEGLSEEDAVDLWREIAHVQPRDDSTPRPDGGGDRAEE